MSPQKNTQKTALQPSSKSGFDTLKWSIVVLLLLLSTGANYYFSHVALAIRAAVGIVLICVLGLVAFQTAKGKVAWDFVKAARSELRKVVWPGRQETVRMTFLVIGVVMLAGLILWGFDTLFIWAITRVMGV